MDTLKEFLKAAGNVVARAVSMYNGGTAENK